MLASRWHSPPKPLPVLSWTTGTCSVGEPVGVEAALHVALQHADAHAVGTGAPSTRSSSVVLPAPGRAHQVDDRHAGAVEVVAVGPRDRVVGVQRVLDDPDLHAMHAAPPRPRSTPPPARRPRPRRRRRRRTPGSGTRAPRSPTRARTARSAAGPGTSSSSSRAPSHGVSRATMPEVEVQRVGHDLAQRARRAASRPSRAGRRRGGTRCPPRREADRELVHQRVGRVGAQLLDRLGTSASARSTAACDRGRQPQADLLDLARLAARSPRPCPASRRSRRRSAAPSAGPSRAG